MTILAIISLLILLYYIYRPKLDFIDNNLIILWYGVKKRKYIKLFRI